MYHSLQLGGTSRKSLSDGCALVIPRTTLWFGIPVFRGYLVFYLDGDFVCLDPVAHSFFFYVFL